MQRGSCSPPKPQPEFWHLDNLYLRVAYLALTGWKSLNLTYCCGEPLARVACNPQASSVMHVGMPQDVQCFVVCFRDSQGIIDTEARTRMLRMLRMEGEKDRGAEEPMAEVISLQLSQGGSTPTCHRPQCGEPTDHELVPHCADARQLAQPQAVSRGFGVVKPLQSRLPSSENLLEESKQSRNKPALSLPTFAIGADCMVNARLAD